MFCAYVLSKTSFVDVLFLESLMIYNGGTVEYMWRVLSEVAD